jgi:hypothetical protein
MTISIETLRAHERTKKLAQDLGITLDVAAAEIAAAHVKNGFKVAWPADPIVTRQFRGSKVEKTFDSRFPATVQL